MVFLVAAVMGVKVEIDVSMAAVQKGAYHMEIQICHVNLEVEVEMTA